MAQIKYDEMKRIVLEMRDAKKIAEHFGCDLRAAYNMKLLVESETGTKIERKIATPVVNKPKLPRLNPKSDPLEWVYEKEKQMMAKGSYELLCAMLNAGQHRWPEDVARQMKKDMGLQYSLF